VRPARPGAYAAVAFLFVAIMVPTTEPTSLYVFWEHSFGFGSITTTLVFATYAVGVIAALLFAGRTSDVDGRRPVLAVCAACSAVSSVLFLVARGLPLLFVGRLVSGVSAGLAAAAATAALVDLAGPGRRFWGGVMPGAVNLLGLGLGPVLGGVLAQVAPHPTTVPFWVHLALLLVAVVVALGLAYRDRADRQGRPVIVHRPAVGLPEAGKGTFAAAALGGFTTFALLGLFTSLVPTFLAEVVHQHHPGVVGATVSLLFGAAVATQLLITRVEPRAAVEFGLMILVAGLGLICAALDIASYGLFLAGTAVAGVATGAAFSGGLSTALSVAGEGERGRVSSLFFLVAYVGLTIPVIAVGIGSTEAGVVPAVITAASVLTAFDVVALGYLRTRARVEAQPA
jgi:MFS family permease